MYRRNKMIFSSSKEEKHTRLNIENSTRYLIEQQYHVLDQETYEKLRHILETSQKTIKMLEDKIKERERQMDQLIQVLDKNKKKGV